MDVMILNNDKFKDALQLLESMAIKIKQPDTNLEESIGCYEEGMKQYRICNDILNEAKQKIQVFQREEV